MNTKEINKKITYLLFEIVFAVIILVLNFAIRVNAKQIPDEIFAYNKIESLELKEIKPLELKYIIPIKDEDALKKYNKSEYQIINSNNTKMNYKLIYKMSNTNMKVEWFNYYLKLDANETIENLGNLGPKNKDDGTYVVLSQGTINAKEVKSFEYLIWLDHNVGNEAQNMSFGYNLVLETY